MTQISEPLPESTASFADEQAEVADLVQQLQDLAAFVECGPLGMGDIPERMGRYRIIDHVGRGGQAEVLLAYDPTTQRSVIIKWYSQTHPLMLTHIVDEARALCAMDHPNIVSCYDVDLVEQQPYLVLRPVSGQRLTVRAIQRPPSAEQAARWMIEICEAVQALHDGGWIHGDLTPQNILIDQQQRPVLIDFGLACRLGDPRHSSGPGTKDFRAPELTASEPSPANPRSDIYSLGSVLRWLLQETVPARQTTPAVPAWLKPCLDQALADQPGDRFKSAGEFGAEIRRRTDNHQRSQTLIARTKVVAAAAVVIGLVFAVLWSANHWWASRQLSAQQHRAWSAFITDNFSAADPDLAFPVLKHDFKLELRWDGAQPDQRGRFRLSPGQPFDLTLISNQSCYIAVYALKPGPDFGHPLRGDLIHPVPGPLALTPAGVEYKVFLEPVLAGGVTELLYVVASPHPWPPQELEHFPGSLAFDETAEDFTADHRGLQSRQPLSERVLAFVVE